MTAEEELIALRQTNQEQAEQIQVLDTWKLTTQTMTKRDTNCIALLQHFSLGFTPVFSNHSSGQPEPACAGLLDQRVRRACRSASSTEWEGQSPLDEPSHFLNRWNVRFAPVSCTQCVLVSRTAHNRVSNLSTCEQFVRENG
ncbi:MAG TPA: hypothetical protein VKR42_05470 [Ktedonobacteraceae bacterium]|nr:hypothetical protein [Ktedonobacteraceae bacterium]